MIRFLAFILLLFGTASVTEAKPPRARQISAVIKEVIPEKRAIIVSFSKDGQEKSLLVRWTRLSSAYEGSKERAFDSLKPGLQVQLRYRTPIFGEPVIRRINWSEPELGGSYTPLILRQEEYA